MARRNPAPWILLLTVIAAGVAFYLTHEANPDDVSGKKAGTAAMIVIGVGVSIMVIAQRFHIVAQRRKARRDAIQAARDAAAAGSLSDPTELEPAALSVALATEPVDEKRLADASDSGWAIADQSQKGAMILTLMIVVLMIPAFVLQDIRLVVYFSIPTVLYGVFLAIRVVIPGGTFDKSFDSVDAQMAHLGLRSVERPSIAVVPRVGGDGAQAKVVGQTVLAGTRHGRAVEVVIDGSRIETRIGIAAPSFELAGHRQRVKAKGNLEPRPEVQRVIGQLGASTYWTGMKLVAGPDGIVVRRKSATDSRWVYDLWLAEALADAFSRAPARV